MTDYDKTMRAIQTLKAQLTRQQNTRGVAVIRQLQALTETITPAPRHANLTTTKLTSMKTELHNLKITLHKLRTDLSITNSPTDATPSVSAPRVQHPMTASAPRVPLPRVPLLRVQQPTTASAPRVKIQPTTQPHDGPASRTRSRLPPILRAKGIAPAVSAPPNPSPPPKPPTQSTHTGPAAGTRSQTQAQGTQNLVQALGTAYDLGNAASTQQLSGRRFPREFCQCRIHSAQRHVGTNAQLPTTNEAPGI